MKVSKQTKTTNPKLPKNFNSIVLSESPDKNQSESYGHNSFPNKAKQIRYLKRFEELFKREYIQKQKEEKNKQQKSHFQHTNKLKGMFILKRKSQFSENWPRKVQNRIKGEQSTEYHHPIQGKSIDTLKETSQDNSYVEKQRQENKKNEQKTKFKKKFVTLNVKRPITQLENKKVSMVFSYEKFVDAILKSNKVSIKSNSTDMSTFLYFSVYVEDGNNCEMIKASIRKRSGWRVVEIPGVANMIWSQLYKAKYDKKLAKRNKELETMDKQIEEGYKKNSMNTISNTSKSSNFSMFEEQSPCLPSSKFKSLSKYRISFEQTNSIHPQQYKRQILKLCPKYEHTTRSPSFKIHPNQCSFYNHIPNNHCISDKRYLFLNLKRLFDSENKDVFEIIPYSVEISLNAIETLQIEKNIGQYWIVKPGEDSNRGRGIMLVKGADNILEQLRQRQKKLKQKQQTAKKMANQSYIIQKYVSPLLYCGRKFDIRMFLLVTLVNNKMRGYLYEEGYVRTCSRQFSFDNFSKYVHLTNDAIQIRCSDYGKYEEGNKISWKKFQSWLHEEGHSQFWHKFQLQTKAISKDILRSVRHKFTKKHENKYSKLKKKLEEDIQRQSLNSEDGSQLNPHDKIYYELFGLDFYIDNEMNIWLIQVNTNPALTTDGSRVVHSLLPKMIDNLLMIAVEPYGRTTKQSELCKLQNKFNAVYDDQWEECLI